MRLVPLVLAAALAACATTAEGPGAATAELDAFLAESHVAPPSAEAFTAYCDAALARAEAMKAALEAPGPRARALSALQPIDNLYLVLRSAANDASLVQETHPDAAIRAAGEACTQRVSEFATGVQLSRPIYERLAAIDAARADANAQHILARQTAAYRRLGVDRDEATRARVMALQAEITELGLAFARNIREDESAVHFSSAAALEGLPADYIANHRPGADGRIRITTQYPDVYPILTYARREETRRRVYTAFRSRAYPANEPVLAALLAKRHELAQTLGFASYAHLITEDKMIGTPERAAAFIDELAELARPSAARDYQRELARLQRIDARARVVPQWSTNYVDQLIMREDYAVDPQQVRRYFPYEGTRDGILALMSDLFGVEFRPWADAPRWHESVEAYEIFDGGRLIGRIYLDMHPRPGKYSHAAQFDVRTGLAGRHVPIGALVCNFPAGGYETGLMEHRDVETFLHEFGHLMHTMFSGQQTWAMGNMGEVEWDFIEAPSQLLEEWVWDYDTLARFAKDETGAAIPRELVTQMNAARAFGEATAVMTQLGYASVSLNYYNRDPAGLDLDAFYRAQMGRYAVYPVAEGTHMFASFGHLDGYSAVYYTYQWSKAIALDLFTQFKANGLLDRATAERYRGEVLAPGGSRSATTLIETFLGRPTSLDAYAEQLRR